eukprot:gnl/Carplike_NY0171/4033_a5456_318.p1 GENE.gnl/Carplike_NY0171/4033_a5456_318~~gnl/Carplike_NY0171/4033_a5456_318.p1  ORF type:complete len:809 (-),score=162.41 gnl/Carplike_NY0171/4033_a5456_318:142-2568(-)
MSVELQDHDLKGMITSYNEKCFHNLKCINKYTAVIASSNPLSDAIVSGEYQKVSLLCEKQPQYITTRDTMGKLPIHYAVENGLQLLLEKIISHPNSDVNARTSSNNTPLHIASAKGFHDLVHFLIMYGADPAIENSKGETPLSLAIAKRHLSVSAIIMASMDSKLINSWRHPSSGHTYLHRACIVVIPPVIELLLKISPSLMTSLDTESFIPVHALFIGAVEASSHDVEKSFMLIAEKYASLKKLSLAKSVRRLLLYKGGTTEAGQRFTPLHIACQCSFRPGIDAILRLSHAHACEDSMDTATGSRPLPMQVISIKDAKGLIPIHWAAKLGHSDVVASLRRVGSCIAAKDSFGCTPLHWAASSGDSATVCGLLSHMSLTQIVATDARHNTAAKIASNKGHTEIAELISRWERKNTTCSRGGGHWLIFLSFLLLFLMILCGVADFILSASKKTDESSLLAYIVGGSIAVSGLILLILYIVLANRKVSGCVPIDPDTESATIMTGEEIIVAFPSDIVTSSLSKVSSIVGSSSPGTSMKSAVSPFTPSITPTSRIPVKCASMVPSRRPSILDTLVSAVQESSKHPNASTECCCSGDPCTCGHHASLCTKGCDSYISARSHHCQKCNRCVAGFDHHCNWINSDIGASNHVIYVVFLIVGSVLLTLTSIAVYIVVFAFPSYAGLMVDYVGDDDEIGVVACFSALLDQKRYLTILFLILGPIFSHCHISTLHNQMKHISEGLTIYEKESINSQWWLYGEDGKEFNPFNSMAVNSGMSNVSYFFKGLRSKHIQHNFKTKGELYQFALDQVKDSAV